MKIFETRDFYLSGYLLYKGYILQDSQRTQGFTIFYFQESPELKRTVSQFYNSKALIDPIIYGMTLRQLKGVIHNSASTQNQFNNNEYNSTKGQI